MPYVFILIAIVLVIYAPQIWVRYILKKYHKHIENMPGTGGELASYLLSKYDLNEVGLTKGLKDNDHYNPEINTVSLSPEVYTGKSLSAVAVAAHEVGHAIQFNRNEPVSQLRGKYLNKAHRIRQIGIFILVSIPIVTLIFRVPNVAFLTAGIGIITMLASVSMYVAILPEEWDASFNKALPILEREKLVPSQHMPAIRRVLRACALTYVAAALADILSLWRWFAIIR